MKETAETGSARPEAARAAPPVSRAEMPPWIPRLIFTVILAVFAAAATFEVIRRLRDLIVWLVIALFLSFALEPAVDWLSERGWRRGIATAATLLGLFLVGVVLIAAMTPLVIQQVQGLIGNVPGWLDRVSVYTHRFLRIDVSTARIVGQLRNLDASVASYARNLAGNLLGFGAAVLEAVFRLFTIGLFTFYLVADGPRFRRVVCSLLRPERQRDVLWAWDVAIKRTGGYLYSRLLLATISGVATFVVLSLTGVAFAAPLALWMGVVSQFIPVVGTYVAMSVPLLVALLDRPVAAVVLAVFFLVYQQVENYFLSPRITARTMQLHPAVAFGAVLAGGSLLGAVGAFLALPAAAILQAGLSTYVRRHEVMETDLTREQTPVSPRARPRRWILGRRSSG